MVFELIYDLLNVVNKLQKFCEGNKFLTILSNKL